MREITLLLHFIGLGLLAATLSAGYILNRQYRRAPDMRTRAIIVRSGRSIGLLSPIGLILLLVTGIGNMHALGVGILDLGWLSAKLVLFIFALLAGLALGVVGKRRGALVLAMSEGGESPESSAKLSTYDAMIRAGYPVLALLFTAILWLSVVGRLGGQ